MRHMCIVLCFDKKNFACKVRWHRRCCCFFFSPNHTSHEIRDWFSDKCNSIYNYLAVAVLLVLQQLCYTIFLWPSSSRSACCHHILTFYSHIWSLRPRPEKGQSKETGQLTFSKADHSFWETKSEMRGLQHQATLTYPLSVRLWEGNDQDLSSYLIRAQFYFTTLYY